MRNDKKKIEEEMTTNEFKDFALEIMTNGPDGATLSDTVRSIQKAIGNCICYEDDELIGILDPRTAVEWLMGENVTPFTIEELKAHFGMN